MQLRHNRFLSNKEIRPSKVRAMFLRSEILVEIVRLVYMEINHNYNAIPLNNYNFFFF